MRPGLLLDLLETGLVAVPALALAYRLSAAGLLSEAVLLPTLCAAAVLQMGRQGPASEAGQACSCRPNAAAGVALGCVSPALLLGGLLLVRTRAEAPLGTLRTLLVAALACAVQTIVWLLATGSPLPHTHAHGVFVALATATLACPSVGSEGAAVVLLSLLLFGPLQRAALTRAKGSFTVGEACALAQGAALLLTDAAVLTACRGGGGGGGGVGSSGAGLCVPRGQATVASEALLAGGFALALLLAWLFGGPHTTSTAGAGAPSAPMTMWVSASGWRRARQLTRTLSTNS
jgi:hypothetical protein